MKNNIFLTALCTLAALSAVPDVFSAPVKAPAAVPGMEARGVAFAKGGRTVGLSALLVPDLALAEAGIRAAFLQKAKEAGANAIVVDAFQFVQDPPKSAKVKADEAGLGKLDALVADARRAGLSVVLTLASEPLRKRYVSWVGASNPGLFYYDYACRQWHQGTVGALLARVNPLIGVSYAADPAVLGFLLDDPAADPRGEALDLERWIVESASNVKGLAPGKMVGVGLADSKTSGIDPVKAASLPGVDFALYRGAAVDVDVITRAAGKPVVPVMSPAKVPGSTPPPAGLAVEWDDVAQGPGSALKTVLAAASETAGPAGVFQSVTAETGSAPYFVDEGEGKVRVVLSSPAAIRVRYGLKGVLDRETEKTAPAASHVVALTGLRAGGEYAYQVVAGDDVSGMHFSERKNITVPGVARLAARKAPYSGRFIRVENGKFVDGTQPLRYVGTNNYYLHLVDDKKIDSIFADAAKIGFTVMRTWAFGCTDLEKESYPGEMDRYFTLGPTTYREKTFQDLDRVVASAKKHQVRVILAFANNWTDYGGKEVWSRYFGSKNPNDFFVKPEIKAAFKAYMKKLATRVNTVTGVAYKDDPIIFAWDLMNEPRCEIDDTGKTLATWVDEMARELKSYGVKQMVTTGSEGHIAQGGKHYAGSDFTLVHSSPAIDFATYHIYPASEYSKWNLPTTQELIRRYVALGHEKLAKPVVMEEFGIGGANPKYDRSVFVRGMTKTFLDAGGDGLNYWMLIDPDYAWGDGNDFSIKDAEMANIFTEAANRLLEGN